MLLRRSSSPVLSSLVSEGDHDCSAFNKPFAASHHCNALSYNRGVSFKHTPSMRRARSETDLQGLVHSLPEAEDRITTAEKKLHLSIIQEKEQLGTSIFEVNKRCLEKEDITINRKPCCRQSARLPAGTSSQASALCAHDGLLVKEGEKLSLACGIGISSNTEDLIMNVGGIGHGCNSGRGGSGGCGGPSGSPCGDSSSTDLYYQKLLQSDPQNPLLLRNYAQFLSEAKHDYKKSEEYYERAILACPNDGEVLSKYANHVWDVHKDSERAGTYFDQAVKATPEDCYVLASYASFLWQSEEEDHTDKVMQTALHPAPSPLMASG